MLWIKLEYAVFFTGVWTDNNIKRSCGLDKSLKIFPYPERKKNSPKTLSVNSLLYFFWATEDWGQAWRACGETKMNKDRGPKRSPFSSLSPNLSSSLTLIYFTACCIWLEGKKDDPYQSILKLYHAPSCDLGFRIYTRKINYMASHLYS